VIEHAQSRKGNKTRPTWFGWPTAFHVFRPGGRTCTLLCLSADRSGAFLTRILIADDRELMRSALKLILAMRPSWKVCGEAEDGRDAITKASELRHDLIVLDFKMPLSDGIQAATEISTALPSTPIIMYTLYKTAELESAAKLAGVRSVVAKEDGVRSLLSAIDAELP
jgi:DNA-binding NarL/FixJ family response regulator